MNKMTALTEYYQPLMQIRPRDEQRMKAGVLTLLICLLQK
jgi:hypothetical protein